MPISFSTCTITTVWRSPSISRRWRIRAAKARASASRFAGAKGDRISRLLPAESFARTNRVVSSFTQAGA